MSKIWFKRGILNTFEQGFTRAADGLFSIALITFFSPENFYTLAMAQASVAPMLLFFVAPEAIMYREFGHWEREGYQFTKHQLSAFRSAGWAKAVLAICLSCLALLKANPADSFFAMIWAFYLALMPQIAGPDREFLRLSLKLKTLNSITFFQKTLMLLGLLLTVYFFNNSIKALAIFTVIVTLLNTLLCKIAVDRFLATSSAKIDLPGINQAGKITVLRLALRNYSFWNHLSGIALGWVQTMDLFMLGLLGLPQATTGLYAVILKVSNLAISLPTAAANSFQLWLGRRISSIEGTKEEWEKQKIFSAALAVIVALTCTAIYLLAPVFLSMIAKGRWDAAEQVTMIHWLGWMLIGSFFLSISISFVFWIQLRVSTLQLFIQVYLPWMLISLLGYFLSARILGFEGTAKFNVAVGMMFLILVIKFIGKNGFKFRQPT
jgi:hypothetical protein